MILNILSDTKSAVWLDVLIVFIAILIVALVVLIPIMRKVLDKKKGLKNDSHCSACSSSNAHKGVDLKKKYDSKHHKDKTQK